MKFVVSISPKRVSRFLLFVVLGLTLANVIGLICRFTLKRPRLLEFLRLFDLDTEGNIPTWYSASALLFCAILLMIISFAKKGLHDRYVFHWRLLSGIFLLLSMDELVSLHERLIEPLQVTFGASGVFFFAWVIPGAIFVLAVLLTYLKFLIDLPARIRRLFLLAGTTYVSGTLFLEMLGAPIWQAYGGKNVLAVTLTTVEEFLEMVGVVIFVYALLTYLSLLAKEVQFCIEPMEASSSLPESQIRL